MKVGVVFSGYGSQYIGMGKEFYDEFRSVQELFEEANNCLDMNFVKLCFAASEQELAKISNAYLAIFVLEAALYRVLTNEGVQPSYVAGLCIGRYAALLAAHGITFPDGLYLLKKYAQFYEEALATQDLKIIKISGVAYRRFKRLYTKLLKTQPALVGQLALAVQLSDSEFMVSGTAEQVELLVQALKLARLPAVTVQDLPLAYDLHSTVMQGIADRLAEYLVKVDFHTLTIPYISGINGKLIQTGKQVRKDLITQIVQPIIWPKVQARLADCDVIIEVGPQPVLSADLQTLYPHKQIIGFSRITDLNLIRTMFNPVVQAGEINHGTVSATTEPSIGTE
ncbi:MAG TPA: ACP S-malonyltransferase [Candidatus Babeliales bacterium]|nr:ACP S-malonyltransferase [Candidatus Babeliales bacterium]